MITVVSPLSALEITIGFSRMRLLRAHLSPYVIFRLTPATDNLLKSNLMAVRLHFVNLLALSGILGRGGDESAKVEVLIDIHKDRSRKKVGAVDEQSIFVIDVHLYAIIL